MTYLFNTLSLTQKRLLVLIQNSLWGKAIDTNLFTEVSPSEWEETMELAALQGVYGLTYDGTKDLAGAYRPPRNLLIKWKLGVRQIESRHHQQIKAIQSLAEFYKENNVKCLLIKGIGIGKLYPEPQHRESGDIDIYLFGDYKKGNFLMEERGIKVDYLYEVHSKFLFEQIPIENHFSFLEIKRSKANREFEIVLHQELLRSVPQLSKELGVYIPSLSFSLLFIHQHAVRHFLSQGIVLRQLCDWALLLHQCRGKDDYPVFYKTVSRFDLERYADAFGVIATECLGLPENEQIVVNHDASFTQRVFLEILNQKDVNLRHSSGNLSRILADKLNSTRLFFQNRWKFEAINNKMFFQEFMIRLGNISKVFNETKNVI
jgi:hypothetical protein